MTVILYNCISDPRLMSHLKYLLCITNVSWPSKLVCSTRENSTVWCSRGAASGFYSYKTLRQSTDYHMDYSMLVARSELMCSHILVFRRLVTQIQNSHVCVSRAWEYSEHLG